MIILIGKLPAVFHCSYTGYIETNYGWILWEKKTWSGSSRAPSVVTGGPSPPECPVIWRHWPSNNITIGMTLKSPDPTSNDQVGDGDNYAVAS